MFKLPLKVVTNFGGLYMIDGEIGGETPEEVYIGTEPWDQIESRMVMWTLIAGILSTIILAIGVHKFILRTI